MKALDNVKDGLHADYIYAYSQLVLEQKYNDRLTLLHSLSEDTTIINEAGDVISIDEGFIDNVAQYMSKMTDTVAAVIEKFITGIQNLIGANQKFLADKKDTILGNITIDQGDAFQNYHNFDSAIDAIKGDMLRYKQENSAMIKQNAERWKTEEDYINSVRLAGLSFDNTKGNFKNQILEKFRGDAITLKDKDISLELRTKMYNYCTQTYKESLSSIQKDKDTILSVTNDIKDMLKGIKDTNPQNAAPTVQQPQNANAAALLQSTMDMYFNEDDNNGAMTVVHTDNGGAQKDENQDANKNESEMMANALKAYTKANNDMLSAKLTLTNEIYTKYIRILKWYVRQAEAKTKNQNTVDNKDKNVDTAQIGVKLANTNTTVR